MLSAFYTKKEHFDEDEIIWEKVLLNQSLKEG
jgi:hypothetical protein